MSLLLTIITAPASVFVSESSKTFGAEGGTIGRGTDNTWALEDPDRFLSSLHCRISSEDGKYFLVDLSTNGTFLNGAPSPMGKGCKLPLHDGDTFSVGDYQFSVSLWNPAQSPFLPGETDSRAHGSRETRETLDVDTHDPLRSDVADNHRYAAPLPDSLSPSSPVGIGVLTGETDPLAALDSARGGLSAESLFFSNPLDVPCYSDQAQAPNQQVTWPSAIPEPESAGVIPSDWDAEMFPSHDPSQTVPAIEAPLPASMMMPDAREQSQRWSLEEDLMGEPHHAQENPARSGGRQKGASDDQQAAWAAANARVEAELKLLKQQLRAPSPNVAANTTVDASLSEAMGLRGQPLWGEGPTGLTEVAGQVIREAVKGLMQVLGSRNSIKNEFRMSVTTIQPVENNPLKFSANVDDALENMFLKRGDAYLGPVESVREGFESVAEHQIAIIAGIRAAFKSVIERFEPSGLEARFQKQRKGMLIPGNQKARNWDMYTDYYSELMGDLDRSFQYLFGDEFVQAYEDQLRKLALAKKATSKSNDR